ncbi:zinc finger MYM-type protein 4-like isoform X1 [Branchiostoma lanceolatum]|uniref:zinc finger MYM-type protein 4-like isoform X1 n=1 Tax=Branchiostoma lanceolatum TaxID=7740 RepID=UPI003456A6E3
MAEERADFGEVRAPSPSEMDVTGSNGQSLGVDDTMSSLETQKHQNLNREKAIGEQDEPNTDSGGPTTGKGEVLVSSEDSINDMVNDASGDVSVAMATKDEEDEPMEDDEDDSSTEPRNSHNNELVSSELDMTSAMQSEHDKDTDSHTEPGITELTEEESSLDHVSHDTNMDITNAHEEASTTTSQDRQTGNQADNSISSNIPVLEPGGAGDSSFDVISDEENSKAQPVECFNANRPTDLIGEYDSGVQQPVTPPTPLQDEDAPTPLQDEAMDTEELDDQVVDSSSIDPSVDNAHSPELELENKDTSSSQDTDAHAISTEENSEEVQHAQTREDSPTPALGLVAYPDSEGEDDQSEKDATEDTKTSQSQEEGDISEDRASPDKDQEITSEEPIETDTNLPTDEQVTTDLPVGEEEEENETEEPVTSHYVAEDEETEGAAKPDSQEGSEALPTILKAFASSDLPIEPDEEQTEETGTQDEADVQQDAEMQTEELLNEEEPSEKEAEPQTENTEQTTEMQGKGTAEKQADGEEEKEVESGKDGPEKEEVAVSKTTAVFNSSEKNETGDDDWDIIDVTDEVKGEPDIITIDDDDEDAETETKKVSTSNKPMTKTTKDGQGTSGEAGVTPDIRAEQQYPCLAAELQRGEDSDTTGKGSASETSKKKTPAPPLLPYQRFCKKKYEDVQKENPAMSLTELAAALFKMWKGLDDKDKQIYKDYYYSEKKVYEADSTVPTDKEVKEEPVDEDSMEAFLKEMQGEDQTDVQLDEAEASLEAIQNEAIQNETEKELKCFAQDTMNELLGMFGYDGVDEDEASTLQISSSFVPTPPAPPPEPASALGEEMITVSPGSCMWCKKKSTSLDFVLKMQNGKTQAYCTAECLARGKVAIARLTPKALAGKVSTAAQSLLHQRCFFCHRLFRRTQDKTFPTRDSNKVFCTEQCAESYDRSKLAKTCEQCKKSVPGDKIIASNGSNFCSQICIASYQKVQSRRNRVCDNCKRAGTASQNFHLAVPGGFPNKVFCSQGCLQMFQKRAKPCTNCKDLRSDQTVIAQVDGGDFKEFCSSECVIKYEEKKSKTPEPGKCWICKSTGRVKHEVNYQGTVYRLCTDKCFQMFRVAHNLSMNCCDQCNQYIYNQDGPAPQSMQFEGQMKRFCSNICVNAFKQKNRKAVVCGWCKLAKSNFDMIERVDTGGKVTMFCSINCLSSFRLKQNMDVGKSIPCNFCGKTALPQYHLTMSDASIRNFCAYSCVMNFQQGFSTKVPVPQPPKPPTGPHLTCPQCKRWFNNRPETFEYKGNPMAFCSKGCSEDFKKANSVVCECDYCHQEKILYESTVFSGSTKNFCSEGCKLLFKQDFAKKLGLRCIVCDYCAQTCRKGPTKTVEGKQLHFCSNDCKEKYTMWYFGVARCDGCKRQGKLAEKFVWRGEMKRVCNQTCLLQFYMQQNFPNMSTQKGPENTSLGGASQPTSTPIISSVMSLASGPQAVGIETPKPSHSYGTRTATGSKPVQTSPRQPPPLQQMPQQAQPQVIVQQAPAPPPKQLRNKSLQCRPFMQTKATSCKPHTTSKGTSTEDDWKPKLVVIPIPVPIYVPVPMMMYNNPVPQPLPMPLPVPVPMWIPTLAHNTDQILKTMEDIKEKIPSNPFEADILLMAEMVAGEDEQSKKEEKEKEAEAGKDDSSEDGDVPDPLAALKEVVPDVDLSLEDAASVIPSNLLGHDVLAMAEKMSGIFDEPLLDLENDLALEQSSDSLSTIDDSSIVTPRRGKQRSKGVKSRRGRPRKRQAVEARAASPAPLGAADGMHLKHTYGVNAFRHWAVQRNTAQADIKGGGRMKEDILQMNAYEMNFALSQFVQEVRKPNGEEYAADSVLYLCLGLQQYLYENSRIDNIFTDVYYMQFVDSLHGLLQQYLTRVSIEGIIPFRIEEEILWECKQLGAHSPFVLLNTLLYFNTKHFLLRTPAEHMKLSFSHIMKHWKKHPSGKPNQRSVYLRFYQPPAQKEVSGKRKRDDSPVLEIPENTEIPLRCPVKLYEFYLSKCPEGMKGRNDAFYLVPERSCVPDSPLWYSRQSLAEELAGRMLTRILMVKDIQNALEEVEED